MPTQPTRAELAEQLRAAQADLEKLKSDVAAKVKELTDEHGWCDAAMRGLAEVGITLPRAPYDLTYGVAIGVRNVPLDPPGSSYEMPDDDGSELLSEFWDRLQSFLETFTLEVRARGALPDFSVEYDDVELNDWNRS